MSEWQLIDTTDKDTLPPLSIWIMGTQLNWPGPFTVKVGVHQYFERDKKWLFSARTIDGEPIHITYWRHIIETDKPAQEAGE
jgi:hypothetical protein